MEPVELPLKAKYRVTRTKGRYSGGERGAPKKVRTALHKKGPKSHIPGKWVLVVGVTGKTTMVKMF